MANIANTAQGVYRCGGDINPSRFVKLSTTEQFTVLQAGSGDLIFGVSQEGAKAAPIPSASGLAGVAGDPIRVYGINDQSLIQAGAALTQADTVRSDANGKAWPATSGNRGGDMLESANADELVIMRIRPH